MVVGGAIEANKAGGLNAHECTLILTEGESAKRLAVAGLAAIEDGRDHYGVYAVRGKLLNVRDLSIERIKKNAEIEDIVKILGLQYGKIYDDHSVSSLRYGKLMIMADQDHDGSHIKGLILNLIHTLWPSLLEKVPDFISMMVTPIVKVTHGDITKTFYTMYEYELWKQDKGEDQKDFTIKYYKGLGTSTDLEGEGYFKNIKDHRKDLIWSGKPDDDALDLAFNKSKEMAKNRKKWLQNYNPETYLNHEPKSFSYRTFVHNELQLFFIKDNERSIPSIYDGLKLGQRKVLYSCFKKNLYKEVKVTDFSAYVSEHSAYHHGETNLQNTIIRMAQDYVGSNNINLLKPNGQFGTRFQKGKDHAHPRYLFTQLALVTRSLFHVDDDILLQYSSEDGKKIEPTWYSPIIPMILVNGCAGIGTGWSTSVPKYNPLTIIENVKHSLKQEATVALHPWYRGFKGKIVVDSDVTTRYKVTGIIQLAEETSTARISELPIGMSTEEYKAFLTDLSFIESFCDECMDEKVDFKVTISKEHLLKLSQLSEDDLLEEFHLIAYINTKNMHLLDTAGHIKKYADPHEIFLEFYKSRRSIYEQRKIALLDKKKKELSKCENIARFLTWYRNGEGTIAEKAELFTDLQKMGFAPNPTMEKGATDEDDFNYLVSLPLQTTTPASLEKLENDKDKLMQEVEYLEKSTVNSLWIKDLEELEEVLAEENEKIEEYGGKPMEVGSD